MPLTFLAHLIFPKKARTTAYVQVVFWGFLGFFGVGVTMVKSLLNCSAGICLKCYKMKKGESRTQFMINFMALNKPWLYLMGLSYFLAMIFVWIGNPVLPIQALARYGWAWHHIPEILAFVFLGMYLGSLGHLSLEKISYLDSIAFILIIVTSIVYALSNTVYITAFWVVALIVLLPSFFGYLVIRMHNIRKSKANPN